MSEAPSTNWFTFLVQVEGRLQKLLGLIKSTPDKDSSGLRSAILQQLQDLSDFVKRPTKD